MRTCQVVIVGAGGLGRETHDFVVGDLGRQGALEVVGSLEVVGFLDDGADIELLGKMGAKWLGPESDFLTRPTTKHFLLAIGDPVLREKLAIKYSQAGLTPATFVHSTATIGSNVEMGLGCIVSAGARVMSNSTLGNFVQIDRDAALGHDCSAEDFATLHPRAIASGRVTLGRRSRLGTRSCVLPNVCVEEDAFVGAGAVVVEDVQADSVVVGIPARELTEGV